MDYRNGTELLPGIITDALPFQVFCLKLDDGLIVKTHHNFFLLHCNKLSNQCSRSPSFLKFLTLSLEIPTQNETLSPEQQEMFSWHYCLGHIYFQSLQKLAKLGLAPQHLSKVNTALLCSSCTFATAKKRAWRTKAAPHSIWKPEDACPGGASPLIK